MNIFIMITVFRHIAQPYTCCCVAQINRLKERQLAVVSHRHYLLVIFIYFENLSEINFKC